MLAKPLVTCVVIGSCIADELIWQCEGNRNFVLRLQSTSIALYRNAVRRGSFTCKHERAVTRRIEFQIRPMAHWSIICLRHGLRVTIIASGNLYVLILVLIARVIIRYSGEYI